MRFRHFGLSSSATSAKIPNLCFHFNLLSGNIGCPKDIWIWCFPTWLGVLMCHVNYFGNDVLCILHSAWRCMSTYGPNPTSYIFIKCTLPPSSVSALLSTILEVQFLSFWLKNRNENGIFPKSLIYIFWNLKIKVQKYEQEMYVLTVLKVKLSIIYLFEKYGSVISKL